MTAPARPGGQLSELETRVLRLAATGRTIAAIARALNSTAPAVQDARHRALAKLGARNTANAVLLACHAGYIDGRRQRHGDHPGYEAHIRRGDEICQPCRDGEKAYRAGLREARQAQEGPSAPVSRPRSVSVDSGASGLENASEAHGAASRPKNQTKAA